jgi:hypothetical protein
MHWVIWDAGSNNLVEELDTEDEGLQAVRELVAINSPDFIDDLGLMAMYDEGEPHDVELPPALYGETLKARLAEWVRTTNYEASREVHQKIRRWLAEEDWTVRDVSGTPTIFNIMVTLQTSQAINIYQHDDHYDHITLHEHLTFSGDFHEIFSNSTTKTKRDIAWSVYRDALLMGVDCDGLKVPPGELKYSSVIYFDGLTKDALIQRILLVLRAAALAVRTLALSLAEADKLPEVVPRPLRVDPPTNDLPGVAGLLTLAS